MMASCPKCHSSLISGHSSVMIGILIFPDFQILDASGPISVFEISGRFAGPAAPAIRVLAATPGPVRSSSGVEMLARGLKPSSAISILIVAGAGRARPGDVQEDAGVRTRDRK